MKRKLPPPKRAQSSRFELSWASAKQYKFILSFIRDYRIRYGAPPTLIEMANETGVPRSTMYQILQDMRYRGLISSEFRQARTIRILPAGIALLERKEADDAD